MTTETGHRAPAALPPAPRRAVRAALRAVTLAACVPYLALKVGWIAGSRIGIPEGSALRRDGNSLMALNALTVLMDAAVIALAFLLTRPWGRRVPSWLLALPMWCASGLLAPIVAAFPVQAPAAALRGSKVADDGAAALLDPWVWSVVYSGFIVQALALGTLFVLYARERWGHLWRGRIGDLPAGPTRPARRLAGGVAIALALIPAAMHLVWAAGGTAGLGPERAAVQDFDARVNDASYVLFAVLTVAGVLMLGYGRGRRVPVLVPLVAAWTGSGALACWGGWLLLTTLNCAAGDPKLPTPPMNLTYCVQMITGILVAAAGAHFFAERQAGREAEAARCD
ncbi:hypothetical protein ACIRPT_30885 [Streptomyces sp. NPDC101227]|uniref:hypothetical protein n=1 Tax=Streptomyces sp. NPDC101227 TaxID=3366136 RepID=UPI0037FB8921